MWQQREKIFEVFIEAQEQSVEQPDDAVHESHVVKLSCPNVHQAQWVISSLRRVRYVTEVTDLGETIDRHDRELRVVKLLFNAATTDMESISRNVNNVISASRGSHL